MKNTYNVTDKVEDVCCLNMKNINRRGENINNNVLENCQSGEIFKLTDLTKLTYGYYMIRDERNKRGIKANLFEYSGDILRKLEDKESLEVMYRLLIAKNERVRELLAEKSE